MNRLAAFAVSAGFCLMLLACATQAPRSDAASLEERMPPVIDPAQHAPDAVVARIAADGAICVKTVHGYLARPELADAYPTALIEWYARTPGRNYERMRYAGADAEASIARGIARGAEVTRFLAAANARLLFGSETPSDKIYTNPPGLNGRLEMNNWIAAGVPEEKLFRTLTIDNARTFRLDDRIGTVEAGKTANLLLLGANPLDSVDAYDTIETVFLHGRAIPRKTLSARTAGAEQSN